jgi:hypothetical protein
MTRIDAGLLAENLLILALGYALLYAIGFARLRRDDVRLIGVAYLGGWALLGTVISLTLMAGIPSGVAVTVVVVAALVAVLVVVGRRADDARPAPLPRRRHPLGLVAAACAGAILAVDVVAAFVVSGRNQWDPFLDLLTAWIPRAEIVHSTHALDVPLWQSFVTPWYPPLAPVMYGTTFDFAGGYHPSILGRQQALLGIAFLLAVIALVDWYAPRWVTLPTVALLTTTPWFWWRLGSLLPDQTVAYLITAAAIVCVIWLHERRHAWLGLAVVFLAAATLTKMEGALFGGLLAAVVIVTSFVTQRRTALPAAVLLIGPAMMLPWHLWLAGHRVPSSTADYNTPHLLSADFLLDRTNRLTYAIRYMVHAPFAGPLGQEPRTIAIVIVAAAVIIATTLRLPAIAIAVGAWLTLSFLALAAIYWTSRVDLQFYVSTSASRVGTTLIVAAAALTPLLLGLALRPSASSSRSDRNHAIEKEGTAGFRTATLAPMRKDVREFIRRLEAAGLTVESTPGHYHVLRDGKPLRKANGMPFTLPFSPDTTRWRRTAIVDLRKLGIHL